MWYPDSPSWDLARNAVAISSDDVRFEGMVIDIAVDNAGEATVFGSWPDGRRVTIAPVVWRTEHWLGTVHRPGDRDDFLFTRRDQAAGWAAARAIEEQDCYEDDLDD